MHCKLPGIYLSGLLSPAYYFELKRNITVQYTNKNQEQRQKNFRKNSVWKTIYDINCGNAWQHTCI